MFNVRYCFILAPATEPVADIKEDTPEVANKNENLDKVTGNVVTFTHCSRFQLTYH